MRFLWPEFDAHSWADLELWSSHHHGLARPRQPLTNRPRSQQMLDLWPEYAAHYRADLEPQSSHHHSADLPKQSLIHQPRLQQRHRHVWPEFVPHYGAEVELPNEAWHCPRQLSCSLHSTTQQTLYQLQLLAPAVPQQLGALRLAPLHLAMIPEGWSVHVLPESRVSGNPAREISGPEFSSLPLWRVQEVTEFGQNHLGRIQLLEAFLQNQETPSSRRAVEARHPGATSTQRLSVDAVHPFLHRDTDTGNLTWQNPPFFCPWIGLWFFLTSGVSRYSSFAPCFLGLFHVFAGWTEILSFWHTFQNLFSWNHTVWKHWVPLYWCPCLPYCSYLPLCIGYLSMFMDYVDTNSWHFKSHVVHKYHNSRKLCPLRPSSKT